MRHSQLLSSRGARPAAPAAWASRGRACTTPTLLSPRQPPAGPPPGSAAAALDGHDRGCQGSRRGARAGRGGPPPPCAAADRGGRCGLAWRAAHPPVTAAAGSGPPARSASRPAGKRRCQPGCGPVGPSVVACVEPTAWGSAPEGAGGVAVVLGQQVVQASRGVQVWVGEPAAVAVGPVQRPAAVVAAKLCDLSPAPFGSDVLAPGRPPLDDGDGRPADDGLEPDLVAGVRRYAPLAVAADAGDVGLGEGGRCWPWRHAIAVSVGLGASQGGTLGRAAGLAPWWPQPPRSMSPLSAHGIGPESRRGAPGRWPLGGRVSCPKLKA